MAKKMPSRKHPRTPSLAAKIAMGLPNGPSFVGSFRRVPFMLLVGYEPGTWPIDVVRRPSNTVIWSGQLEVDGPPQQRAWPHANGGGFTTAEGNRTLGVISMPNEWGVVGHREICATGTYSRAERWCRGDGRRGRSRGRARM